MGNRERTHCIHGHRFTPENTYVTPVGHRQCYICQDARCIKYRLNNPEKVKASAAKRRNNTREERRQYSKKYCREHPEKYAAYRSKRRAARTKAGGSYTSEQWEALCKKYNYRCLCCGKKKKLTPDHVIPIAKGGSSNIGNIQPLCKPCNCRKRTGTTDFRKIRLRSKTQTGAQRQKDS
jgi:HNH endonuclease